MDGHRHEGYRVSIEPIAERLQVKLGDLVIADSINALSMTETRQPPVFYVPREDIRMDLLIHDSLVTHCPFKGNATYFNFSENDQAVPLIAWSYEDGFDEAAMVRNFLAFDTSKIDGIYLGNEKITSQPVQTTSVEVSNPFINWLLKDAWRSESIQETLAETALMLRDSGMRLSRLKLFVRTLNPQLYGKLYTWRLGQAQVEESTATHKGMLSETHLNSPYATIINGEGGIRRTLEGNAPKLDYPILHELLEEGATDYVALPMHFSDSQINILSLVSSEPGGFSTTELGYLYEILPLLGRLFEAHAQRDSALTLLQTYLGKNAGKRVLNGHIKRGDGEDIDAIIWFSDLRDSTRMADSMDRLTYLKGLDQYFDCVAGAVVTSGGEVLKFIGDAILVIFPIGPSGLETACSQTISALQTATRAISHVNEIRAAEDLPALKFGTGLHRGNITYGNIGAEARLDFTVIGPAVNEASRIEGLCKKLGHSVVASAAFAEGLPSSASQTLGQFELAGVKHQWELFSLNNEALAQ